MAMYVYKDSERTIELYARDALKENKDTRYYCPNPECDAHMYMCGVDGVSSTYFSANRLAHRHIKGCDFDASNSFNSAKFDEKAFDFQKVLENMKISNAVTNKKKLPSPHKDGESMPKPLRTIRQVYDMCKSYPCTHSYNGLEIGQMLLDDRSEYMYPKGVFNNKIIESRVKSGMFYDSDKSEIRLVAPSSKKYEFILQFSDEVLFKTIKNDIYNNRDKLIIVAGYWQSSGTFDVFCAEMFSKKQIAVISK